MRNLGIFITVIMVGLFLVSCGGQGVAPTPTPVSTPAIDAEELYATNCVACHGPNRQGISGLGLPLTPQSLAAQSDSEIRDIVLKGKTGTAMIAWETTLSSEEVEALLQFIKYTSP